MPEPGNKGCDPRHAGLQAVVPAKVPTADQFTRLGRDQMRPGSRTHTMNGSALTFSPINRIDRNQQIASADPPIWQCAPG
jgi:hypothetical protein